VKKYIFHFPPILLIMRGVQITILLVAVQTFYCYEHKWKEEGYVKNYFDAQECAQVEPNCEECVSRGGSCEWCSDGSHRSECIKQRSENCPRQHRTTTCVNSQTAEDERKKTVLEYYDKSLDELQAMDAPEANNTVENSSVVTVNASVFCGRQGGCKSCTSHEFCFWCESKKTCEVLYNASTTHHFCHKKGTAYKGQCIYSIGVTPCPERKRSCKKCLQGDNLCYWCSSTAKCALYPSENFEPEDCAKGRWYYKECPVVKDLLWVLFPILAIILIPIIVYLIIWLICCCMRAAGYEPLEQTEPSKKKRPKGIRLKPGSPSNKTDELRQKYDLNNP